MADRRVLCRWPEWQKFRAQLVETGKVNEEKLQEIEFTLEVDSLEIVELIMAMEEAYGIEFVDGPRS